jgi:hypothetical protein
MRLHTSPLIRTDKKYSVEEILNLVQPKEKSKNGSSCLVHKKWLLDYDFVKISSQRLVLFKNKGISCVCCGLIGQYFVKEKKKDDISYHLNLYALDSEGNEILMTKDHIIPVSKGGKNHHSNYQVMCTKCNLKKADKIS